MRRVRAGPERLRHLASSLTTGLPAGRSLIAEFAGYTKLQAEFSSSLKNNVEQR